MQSSRGSSALTPVLMLVPYFAPQSHAAVFRAHKLARYLPEHGFRPIVVTTDTNYLYNEDPTLLSELPQDVVIHRASYREPSLRGLRMALGGRDRSFTALKPAHHHATTTESTKRPSWRRRLGSGFARMVAPYPDSHWTWSWPAYRMATRLIEQHDIRLMYTSANPVSPLRAALRLQKTHALKWLFDARDPLGYGRKHTAQNLIGYGQERSILRRAMHSADRVTGLSRSYGQIFFDQFGLPEDKFTFVPTGIDHAYLPPDPPAPRGKDLVFVGEVMQDQTGYAFTVFEHLLNQQSDDPSFDRLVFVGRRDINEPIIARLTQTLPRLSQRLLFLDHQPQASVYRLIQNARACLLLPGSMRYWWNNFAKMVDYIGLGAPVIAHVPYISEARAELEKAGNTFFLQGDDSDPSALAEWLGRTSQMRRSDYANVYTAQHQVASFAGILRHLMGREGAAA